MEDMVRGYTILITGGTGFLGSHLVNSLCFENRVIVTKRSFSNTWRIENPEFVNFYNIDEIDVNEIFEQNMIDVVINTATKYGRQGENVDELIEANYLFPLKIFKNSINNNVKSFINTHTVLPKYLNAHSLTKNHFTDWLKFYSNELTIFNLKLEYLYGEKDSETQFIPYIITSLLKNIEKIDLTEGTQERNFIYVEDVVEAYKRVILKHDDYNKGFYEYEIGSSENIRIRDLVLKIKDLIGNKKTELNFGALNYRKNEPMKSTSNIEKFKKEFDWEPKTNLTVGLTKTINWYKGKFREK